MLDFFSLKFSLVFQIFEFVTRLFSDFFVIFFSSFFSPKNCWTFGFTGYLRCAAWHKWYDVMYGSKENGGSLMIYLQLICCPVFYSPLLSIIRCFRWNRRIHVIWYMIWYIFWGMIWYISWSREDDAGRFGDLSGLVYWVTGDEGCWLLLIPPLPLTIF